MIQASVTAVPPGGTLAGDGVALPFSDGTVTLDRTAQHRGGISVQVSDPSLYPINASDLLNPVGTVLYATRGIAFPDGSVESVALGQYRLESVQRDGPGGGLTLTGWDKSRQLLDERFTIPTTIASGSCESRITNLIAAVYASGQTYTFATTGVTIPKTTVEQDRWPTIQQFAQLAGCEIYPDNVGHWILRATPDPATATSVWSINAGADGVLVSATDVTSREGAPNGIVATGTPITGTPPAPGIVHDDAVASPTLWGGAYGHVPAFYSSPNITTHAQAVAVATAMLRDFIGAWRTIDFGSVPNPALEPGDAVTIVNQDGTSEVHMLDALTIPLSASGGAMTGSSRVAQVLS